MEAITQTERKTERFHTRGVERMQLQDRYRAIRAASESLAEPLSPEDCVAQSMPDASPVKWHLAHTTWFFEKFVLEPYLSGYKSFHPQFNFLFNSYYNQVGDRIARPNRGLMTRPSLDQVYAYRKQVDNEVLRLLESADVDLLNNILPFIETGLHHEQQHQELILTDVKHLLSCNPLKPAYHQGDDFDGAEVVGPIEWIKFAGGVHEVGHNGNGFGFDNEFPRHKVYLDSFQVASRLVTNREFLHFMEEDGYSRPELWLDMGWATVQKKNWASPLYWENRDGEWHQFTLSGLRPVVDHEPVTHVSYFEADAYARWAGVRLTTEQEWEVASSNLTIEGNFVESGILHPSQSRMGNISQIFGDTWEWTRSQYSPYPGYTVPKGAIGEYNGKFMCNQFVLRGGSCATPTSHIRRTYRNFFPPEARWQFTGIRLAKDV